MGHRVLITRESPEPLAGMLAALGLSPVHASLVELYATEQLPPGEMPDVVFVTSRAVPRFIPDLASHIGPARVYAVGQRTASALEAVGVSVAGVGDQGGSTLLSKVNLRADQRVWYVGAAQPSGGLLTDLSALPCSVDHWQVYDNRCPADADAKLHGLLPVDVVTFTSGSAVTRFCERAGVGNAAVVVIGQTTAQEAQRRGLVVAGCPSVPSLQGMANAVHALVRGSD